MPKDSDVQTDRTGSPLEPAPHPAVEHVRVELDDAPDEFALFPREGSEEGHEREWLVAQGASFVDLESMA